METSLMLMQWLPNVLIALSLASSFVFFLFVFILIRGLMRLGHLKEISATLKRIEKLMETKGKAT